MKLADFHRIFLRFLDVSFWKHGPKTFIAMLALSIFLGLGIFLLDISREPGVTVSVLYVLVVLMGSSFPSPYGPMLIAAITSGLVIVGGFLAPPGSEAWKVMINRSVALLVIWGAALVIHQYRSLKATRIQKILLKKKIRKRTQDLARKRDQSRKLAAELTLVEQHERRRLATDLHDYLAQLLVVCHMKTQKALASPRKQLLPSELAEVDNMLDQALAYTRTLVAELCPTVLYDLGLAPALHWLSGQMAKQGLSVHVNVGSNFPNIAEDQAVLLYQSVRELLFNVLKHAGTNVAEVFLDRNNSGTLEVMVCDSGKGCDMAILRGADPHHKTFGLFNIQERLEAMKGRLIIQSRPKEGMKVILSVPFQSPQVSLTDYPQESPATEIPLSMN